MGLVHEMALRRQKEKAPKETEKEPKPIRGRVISSYYSAEDVKRLRKIAEKEGVGLGGIQHEATMRFLEDYLQKNPDLLVGLEKAPEGALSAVIASLEKELEQPPQTLTATADQPTK